MIKSITSPTMEVRRFRMNFWMLSDMRRPSSTAATMLAKLSSARTMSAALFATSEPERPMAMPTSAAWREGASLTPSPVIAAKALRRWRAAIMRVFVLEAQRAMTRGSTGKASTWTSVMVSNSVAVFTKEEATSADMRSIVRGRMPTSFAMALAVEG